MIPELLQASETIREAESEYRSQIPSSSSGFTQMPGPPVTVRDRPRPPPLRYQPHPSQTRTLAFPALLFSPAGTAQHTIDGALDHSLSCLSPTPVQSKLQKAAILSPGLRAASLDVGAPWQGHGWVTPSSSVGTTPREGLAAEGCLGVALHTPSRHPSRPGKGSF